MGGGWKWRWVGKNQKRHFRGTRLFLANFARRLLCSSFPFHLSNRCEFYRWCDLVFHNDPRGGHPIIRPVVVTRSTYRLSSPVPHPYHIPHTHAHVKPMPTPTHTHPYPYPYQYTHVPAHTHSHTRTQPIPPRRTWAWRSGPGARSSRTRGKSSTLWCTSFTSSVQYNDFDINVTSLLRWHARTPVLQCRRAWSASRCSAYMLGTPPCRADCDSLCPNWDCCAQIGAFSVFKFGLQA